MDGKGNYWGLTCAEGGFEPTKVLQLGGTVNPNVVDSHPFGEPVAGDSHDDDDDSDSDSDRDSDRESDRHHNNHEDSDDDNDSKDLPMTCF